MSMRPVDIRALRLEKESFLKESHALFKTEGIARPEEGGLASKNLVIKVGRLQPEGTHIARQMEAYLDSLKVTLSPQDQELIDSVSLDDNVDKPIAPLMSGPKTHQYFAPGAIVLANLVDDLELLDQRVKMAEQLHAEADVNQKLKDITTILKKSEEIIKQNDKRIAELESAIRKEKGEPEPTPTQTDKLKEIESAFSKTNIDEGLQHVREAIKKAQIKQQEGPKKIKTLEKELQDLQKLPKVPGQDLSLIHI